MTSRLKTFRPSIVRIWIFGLLLAAFTAVNAGAAGLLVADGGFGGVLEIAEHDVRVTFNNGVVVTEVTQVFTNTENRTVEALYTFPVPEGASVSNFSMWINGQEMVGEVVEKERAREIYNSYKQQPQPLDPGLLEQVDYKTFEMRIFPIFAGAEQRVQITYYQELSFDHDQATYVYPLATSTRQEMDSRTQGRFAFNLDVMSEIPVTAVESPSHKGDFVVVRHAPTYYQASLETQGGDLNRDVVLTFETERPRTGLDLVVTREDGEDGTFLLTLTAGPELEGQVNGMDYVFVLDVSGSMSEDGKLATSRSSISAFVEALSSRDRFEMLSFNVAAESAFGGLRSADATARSDGAAFLRSRNARGGTTLRPAIELAYRYKDVDRPLNVVILSDGMTEEDERNILLKMIGQRPNSTRVFCIGVGNDVNRPLLQQIADEAGGLAAFISRGDNFARQAAAFKRKLTRPVGTNLTMGIEGVDAYDVEPRQLPNLFHGAPIRLYGRYRGAGPAQVRIQGTVGGEILDQTVELDFPEEEAANPEIERMWAWHRVERLLREAEKEGSRSGVIDEIVRLGEGFSIVTEYTSFLVLENDSEYQRWKIERRNALRTARDREALREVREQLETLRQRSALKMAPEPAPVQIASSEPQPTVTTPQPQVRTQAPQQPRRRSIDLVPSGGGGGGGGAIDPLSAFLALLMAGLAFAALRRS